MNLVLTLSIFIGIWLAFVGATTTDLRDTDVISTTDACKFICKCPPQPGTEDFVVKCRCSACADPYA